MNLEQVNNALMNGATVLHTQHGISLRYKLTGVITRFSKQTGWTYSLELTDLNTPCVVIASVDDVEVGE